MTDTVTALAAALATGAVEVVDCTQPLREDTPVIRLPPPFANTPGLTVHRISAFDEPGPFWAWNWLEIGEHVGTHFDAPCHWITGRDGATSAACRRAHLVGPAVVIDRVAETEADPDYLLTPDDIRAFEAEHGPLPEGGWLLLRTGWDRRAHDAGGVPQRRRRRAALARVRRRAARASSPRRRRSSASASRRSASTRAAPAAWIRRSPCHYHVLGAGKYGLTQLANLERLPPTGARARRRAAAARRRHRQPGARRWPSCPGSASRAARRVRPAPASRSTSAAERAVVVDERDLRRARPSWSAASAGGSVTSPRRSTACAATASSIATTRARPRRALGLLQHGGRVRHVVLDAVGQRHRLEAGWRGELAKLRPERRERQAERAETGAVAADRRQAERQPAVPRLEQPRDALHGRRRELRQREAERLGCEGDRGRVEVAGRAHLAARREHDRVVGRGAELDVDATKFRITGIKNARDGRGATRIGRAGQRDMPFAREHPRSGIETHPPRARQINFRPRVQVGKIGGRTGGSLQRLYVGCKLNKITGDEASGKSQIAKNLDQEPCRIATGTGCELERLLARLHARLHADHVTYLVLHSLVQGDQKIDRAHAVARNFT